MLRRRKKREAPPPGDKSVHTLRRCRTLLADRVCASRPASTTWRFFGAGRYIPAQLSPARLFLVSAKRVTCASGTSIFINPRMNVCIFIRRLDQLRAEEAVACKKKEKEKKDVDREKFRQLIILKNITQDYGRDIKIDIRSADKP